MSLRISLEVDPGHTMPLVITNPEQAFFEEITKAILRALRWGEDWARRETPVAATGALRGSIRSDFNGRTRPDYRGEIVWGAGYAETAIRGAGARSVPLSRLSPWSAVVLGDASLAPIVQSAIARQGTPSPKYRNLRAHNIDNRLIQVLDPHYLRIMEGAAIKIAKRLERP